MSPDLVPVDQHERDRITQSLDETLFVEAGAGTGKTAALVTRIVNLVASGRATIDGIAAITFTEAASSELRDRVRQELEDRRNADEASGEERRRCLEAARSLGLASMETLHGFARSLLREMPLEAGLPPEFDTADEIEAGLAFAERWDRWLDTALRDPETAGYLERGSRLGLRLDSPAGRRGSGLRTVAREFHRNYDMLGKEFPRQPEPARQAARSIADARAELRRLLPLAKNGPEDPLAEHATRVAALGDRLATIGGDSEAALSMLARWGRLSQSRGRMSDWDVDPESGDNGCKILKAVLKDMEDERGQEQAAMRRAVLSHLAESLRQMVLSYADERRAEGRAEFHDLLVWARNLLRDNPAAREHLQRKYTHILVDEFQDTDPLQAEMAFFLAGTTVEKDVSWTEIEPAPGKLFVVGDPKQSIYRFRRADIATLGLVRDRTGSASVQLQQNFRSQEPLIRWVNAVFGEWMCREESDTQARYRDLSPWWEPPAATPLLGVHRLGGAREGRTGAVRTEGAEAMARLVQHIRRSQWQVRDDRTSDLRSAVYSDVCVLLPSRTSLPVLEYALEAAAIPYRIESESMVLDTQEVRDLLSCLRAVDAPSDQLALVAALRSPAFGCSDVELLQFVDSGGRFDYTDPGEADGPVREAMDTLRDFHEVRTFQAPAEIIERLIRGRRMVEAGFGRRRPRERWRRLRFVLERARAFARVGGTSLRAFLDWMDSQAEEGARMVEVPVPETDDDAVRIMTIHAAKGLEFPIVVLAGLDSGGQNRAGPVLFDRSSGAVEVRIGSSASGEFATPGYTGAQAREDAAAADEAIRLMYVAATRARDHLIVNLYRPDSAVKSQAAVIELMASAHPDLWREVEPPPLGDAPSDSPARDFQPNTADDRRRWAAERDSAFEKARRPVSVSATELSRTVKEEAEGGEAPFRRGRAGTSLGRAVHSTLQTVDLETGAGLDDVSRAQAAAEGIAARWREVARLARTALDAPAVRRAVASGRYYREVFASADVDGTALEGFIDLLFEDEGELVLIDYKTDAVDDEADLDRAAGRYGAQVGAYALALGSATGVPVREAILLYLHAGKPVAFSGEKLEEMQAQARRRMTEVAGRPEAD